MKPPRGLPPADADNAAFREWFARSTRSALSPSGAHVMLAARAHLDVRDVLDRVVAPTLVVHRTGDRLNSVEHGRYLARRLTPPSTLSCRAEDHLWWVANPDEIAGW